MRKEIAKTEVGMKIGFFKSYDNISACGALGDFENFVPASTYFLQIFLASKKLARMMKILFLLNYALCIS